MRPLELGLVLPLLEDPVSGDPYAWEGLKGMAKYAEQVGFDTVWVADELLWKIPSWPGPRGSWECVAVAGAVAATTSKIKVGTWVLSALHRNPGLTAKVAETVDEISGGRFILGFGAGHAGTQGEAFGYPLDRTVGRYEEALKIVVSLLKTGEADFDGDFHSAAGQVLRPRGPRPGSIPLMLAGHGPRNIGLAVKHGDIWSAFATESSQPEAFKEMIQLVTQTCEDQDRDPASLSKSIGVFVEPTDVHVAESLGLGVPLTGSPAQIAEKVQEFAEMGVNMLELVPFPDNNESVEALNEILRILDE